MQFTEQTNKINSLYTLRAVTAEDCWPQTKLYKAMKKQIVS